MRYVYFKPENLFNPIQGGSPELMIHGEIHIMRTPCRKKIAWGEIDTPWEIGLSSVNPCDF